MDFLLGRAANQLSLTASIWQVRQYKALTCQFALSRSFVFGFYIFHFLKPNPKIRRCLLIVLTFVNHNPPYLLYTLLPVVSN
jgi:hypothetical protein